MAGHHAFHYERIVRSGRGVSDEVGGVCGMHVGLDDYIGLVKPEGKITGKI